MRRAHAAAVVVYRFPSPQRSEFVSGAVGDERRGAINTDWHVPHC